MSITFNNSERERLADAVQFYIERWDWSAGDGEKAKFERMLADLNGRTPRNALVESLRDSGMMAMWAEVVADTYIEYAGFADSEMTDEVREGFTVYLMECEELDREFADGLVKTLRSVLPSPPPARKALVSSLIAEGLDERWAEYVTETFYEFAGSDAENLTASRLTDGGKAALLSEMLDDDIDDDVTFFDSDIDGGMAHRLVESLATVLEKNAQEGQA